ncbi:MAG: hypothetical protein COA86_08570 [Kangiella sp.]|nr:MAG: hypothetical protein COA86_08570 [Kangiella sp.]
MINVSVKCQFDEFILDINEQFPSDKIIGLFGSSGSGKSKLLRQMLGFDLNYQQQVSIQFNSKTWQDKATKQFELTEKRGIGYLPQTVDLFSYLNVEDNIKFGTKNQSLDSDFYKTILLELDIEELTKKLPNQLSGGQKQRVGLARAVISAKQLLILDEPFSAIGEDHKPQIMRLLKTINKNSNLPIIFSSHNRYEHAYLTEHLVNIDNGKVTQSGAYSKLSTDINNSFAQAPGAVNHLEAKSVSFDDDYYVNQLVSQDVQLWAGFQPIEKDRQVHLEVRAKDISIALTNTNNTSILNCLPVKLVASKEISRHQYLLKLAFNNTYLIAFITKKSFIDLKLKDDMDIFALFKAVSVLPISN